MSASRAISNIYKQNPRSLFSLSTPGRRYLTPSNCRGITSTAPLQLPWMDSIKGVFTGKKSSIEQFTLPRFADDLKRAKQYEKFRHFVGCSSDATFDDFLENLEPIIRTSEVLILLERISKLVKR